MSGDLTISGGGSYAVASDALFTDAQALEVVRDELHDVTRSLGRLDAVVSESLLRRADAPISAVDAERDLDRARQLGSAAGDRAGAIAFVLRAAADGYGRADRAAQQIAQQLAANLGYALGRFVPLAVLLLAPALPELLAGALIGSALFPGATARLPGAVGGWLIDNNRLITNPLTAALVRAGVMSADDFLGGILGLPPGVVHALGDEGAGVAGINTSAAIIAAAGSSVGLFTESRVATRSTGAAPLDSAPSGLAERLDRVPQRTLDESGQPRGEHIRIERYGVPGEADRFAVYITGTADFSPVAGREAFDLTSDVTAMAELPAGAIVAVRQAMEQQGITADSPVQFTGYSQGGLIAVALAASGDFNTQGVVAIGSPTAQVALGDAFPVVEIEHTDDIVPALGGNRIDHDAVLVQREAFADREPTAGIAVPAHDRGEYRTTAVLADRAGAEQLSTAIARLDAFTAGATTMTSTGYVAERVRP